MSAVVALNFPHSAIGALTAVRHVRAGRGERLDEPVHVIAIEQSLLPQATETLRDLVSRFPEVQLWVPTPEEQHTHFRRSRPLRSRSRDIRKRLGGSVRELYYSHDFHLSFIPQSLMWAWPDARRVCFGDALGIAYSLRHYRQTYLSRRRQLWDDVRTGAARVIGFLPRRLDADIACLVLPRDPGGDFFLRKRLEVPPVATVREVLALMSAGVRTRLERIPLSAEWLLLLSNFSGGLLARVEDELRLYEEILSRFVPAHSKVLVKPHPGTPMTLLEAMDRDLRVRWDLEILDPSLKYVPIETMTELVTKTTVLSTSFTTVSLPYLHGSKVIHALDDSLIDRWILPGRRKWVREGNDEYLGMAARLPSWDRRSAL